MLCAYIVTRESVFVGERLLAELRASFAAHLPHYMHPTVIVGLASMPRTPNGKLDRKALPTPAASSGAGSQPAGEDSTLRRGTEKRLRAIWKSVLGLRDVESSDDFFALGGHSLLAARLLRQVEAVFGVRLTLATLLAVPTLAQQVQLLLQQDARHYDFRREARLHSSGSKAPLIAIHNTGVYYYNLAQLLGAEQPLTALQVFDPALARSSLPTSLEEIAAEYVQLIRQAQPCGPYQLLGWCVGGVLAVEIARQLRQQQQVVSFLCLIDAWAPDCNQRMSKLRAWLAQRSYRLQLVRADWQRVLLQRQSTRDFLRHRVLIKRMLKVLGHAPAEPVPASFENRHLSSEHYDRWLDSYLDEMAARYVPQRVEIGNVLICSSSENRGWFLDPQMGWSGLFIGTVEMAPLQGDHFTVFQSQGLAAMAEKITVALSTSAVAATAADTSGKLANTASPATAGMPG
jgi:thioesterase domain-containing protein